MASEEERAREKALKQWLNDHEEALVEQLDPEEMVRGLRTMCPTYFDQRDRDDVLLKYSTPRERTEKLVDILRTRTPEVLEAFQQLITTLYPDLASTVQPVSYHILWLCPSARHAAMVVHILELYSGTQFLQVEEGGPDHLIRRSSGRALGVTGASVKLVFPIRPELFPRMLAETVRTRDRVDLAILTGHCEALGPRVPVGQAVIPASSSERGTTIPCPTAEKLQREKVGFEGASWAPEQARLYMKHAYMDYCAVWLGRLYVELTSTARGQRSGWLERLGWEEEGGLQNERNVSLLARCLPEWGTGQLARNLLRERRTWQRDINSPLGLAPKEALSSCLCEKKKHFNGFPAVIGSHAPSGLVFNPISPPGGGGDVTDDNTHQFYQTCHNSLRSDADWLACLSVCHDILTDCHELTAFTAITMAMEVARTIRL